MSRKNQHQEQQQQQHQQQEEEKSFRDFELEQEERLSRLGKLTARANDLDAELRRLGREIPRVTSVFFSTLRPSSSFFSSSYSSSSSSSSQYSSLPLSSWNSAASAARRRKDGTSNSRDLIDPSQVAEEMNNDDDDDDNYSYSSDNKNKNKNKNNSSSSDFSYVGVGAMQELNLTPKRNLGWAAWNAFSNSAVSLRLAASSLVSYPVRDVRTHGPVKGMLLGATHGVSASVMFLGLGLVASPLIHFSAGAINNLRGFRNIFKCDRTFDVYSGSYLPSNIRDNQNHYAHLFTLEQQILKRANRDHKRQKVFADFTARKWPIVQMLKDRLGSIGGLGPKASGGTAFDESSSSSSSSSGKSGSFDNNFNSDNYYSILQIPPSASEKQIKQSYGKLAKVFHPDIDPSPKARIQFDRVTKAYQTLINPQLRKAYDAGGAKFAEATRQSHQQQQQQQATSGSNNNSNAGVNVAMEGTPMEVMQRIFGGLPFEQLVIGPIYRSMFHCRAQSATRINLHTYESIETLRMLRLATVLTAILDTYAMSDEALALFTYRALLVENEPQIAAKIRPHLLTLFSSTSSSSSHHNNRSHSGGGNSHFGNRNPSSSSSASSSSISEIREILLQQQQQGASAEEGGGEVKERLSKVTPPLDSFTKRSAIYAHRLSRCCFGKELLYEVGSCYSVNARRYLGETAMWKPRLDVTLKATAGLGKMFRTFKGPSGVRGGDPSQLVSPEDVSNFFSIEFDNVVCNLHMIVRFVAITSVKDTSIPLTVSDALFPSSLQQQNANANNNSNSSSNNKFVFLRHDPDGSQATCPKVLFSSAAIKNNNNRNQTSSSSSSSSVSAVVKPRSPSTSQPMREILSILNTLPVKEREQVTRHVSSSVQRARCVAMKELGRVYQQTGTEWVVKPIAECVKHIREYGTAKENSSLPSPF